MTDRKEADIQAEAKAWIESEQAKGKPIFFRKVPVGPLLVSSGGGASHRATNPMRGFPDWLMCVWGRFVAVEFKRPKGFTVKSTAEKQQEVRDEILDAGGVAVVAETLADVQEIVRRIERQEKT